MDQVIVHVGCISLKDSQELVSCCLDVIIIETHDSPEDHKAYFTMKHYQL